jgi:hypothetical protein
MVNLMVTGHMLHKFLFLEVASNCVQGIYSPQRQMDSWRKSKSSFVASPVETNFIIGYMEVYNIFYWIY